MIKINLCPDVAAAVQGVDPQADMVDTEIQRKGLVHLLMIGILPAALFVYGAQKKPEKQNQIKALKAQLAELTSFNNKQVAIVAEITKIENDEKDVEKKIDAISSLTQGRLVEIKVLDLLQSIVRDKMWIRLIDVDNSKVSIEGMAQAEMDVSLFLNDLTRNVLLRDVRLLESQQELYDGQTYSRFKIAAFLEKSK